MTREELEARLAECEGHTPGEWPENRNTVENLARDIEAWRGGESWKDKTGNFERSANANKKLIALAPSLASALREAWAEIDRLQHIVDEKPLTFLRGLEDEAIEKLIHQNDELRAAISKAAGDLSFLDAALNEGDGGYRP